MVTPRISKLKIGPRLVLCFAVMILLVLAGNSLLAWQFYLVNEQSDRVAAMAQELAVVSRFQTDLLSLDTALDSMAKSDDVEGLRREARHSRTVLAADVEAIKSALVRLPSELRGEAAPLLAAEAVETTWLPQLDSVIALGATSDWNAVRLRLADEKQPIEARASDLVRGVQQQVADELIRSVLQREQIKRRILLILPLTAFLMLMFAVLLATSITRSITIPLRQLLEGSAALARGEFDYQVHVQGKDELAQLGSVFNETSATLGEVYRRLEEAQRIAHVGYWERDLATDRITWSDETYRIFGLQPQEHPMDLAALRQRIHPEDRAFMSQAIDDALSGSADYNIEYRLLRPTHEVRTVHSKGAVKRDTSGRPYQMFGTVQDVTDRKHAEETLQKSQFYLSEGQRLAQMGSWAFNPLGFFDYWSDELFQIYGLDAKDGAPTLERYLATLHAQDRESMAETIRQMHLERCGCDVKKRVVRPDGELRYVRCVGIPVVEDEVLRGFLGTAIDITDQELLTRELEHQRAYLTEAQKLTHTGSWVWRVSDRFAIHLSEEWYRIYDFNPAEGPPPWEKRLERVYPEDRLKWKGAIERALAEKTDYDVEFRILLPSGTVKWIHTVGHPVFSHAGELVQFVGISTDITERKSAEWERERLHQLENDLAHINRVSMLGEMAASLAHEIKQPIAAAITSANTCMEWLAHDPPNLDRARAAVARIDKYGNRAAQIIDHIRSFYKRSPSQYELVDANGIVEEIFTLLQDDAIRYSITMRPELAAQIPRIKADRVQLQQVFMNLMLNGIEAMHNSGGELTVRSQSKDGQLLFSVSDTGLGLPTENVDQIYSPFYTTKQQGSGMGLAISRTIVESHGGRLWATANNGRGATFHFTLPTDVRDSPSST